MDELGKCGHYRHWETDFRLVRELGISFLRYGPPLHRTFFGPGQYDWELDDLVFARMHKLGIVPIVDVCHFGVPDWQASPLDAPYAAAKAALLSLTRSAAIEGTNKRIRVNAVLPGAIDTPMLWNNPNVQSGAEKIDPKDVGQPAHVAAAIAFLASDDAAFIQGTTLIVDGGRLARL